MTNQTPIPDYPPIANTAAKSSLHSPHSSTWYPTRISPDIPWESSVGPGRDIRGLQCTWATVYTWREKGRRVRNRSRPEAHEVVYPAVLFHSPVHRARVCRKVEHRVCTLRIRSRVCGCLGLEIDGEGLRPRGNSRNSGLNREQWWGSEHVTAWTCYPMFLGLLWHLAGPRSTEWHSIGILDIQGRTVPLCLGVASPGEQTGTVTWDGQR